jgi:hypothetical protein
MDILRVAAGSRTGRQHYTDMRSALLDARESAEAVRALLDEAVAALAHAERRDGRAASGA